ncbi:MAG TPA: formate dehydrogenase accessory protein FdhE [Chloroflexota bacterium]|nr:formate dehydrogenase accessory protein FdhE [Chloroflexota bacterium]
MTATARLEQLADRDPAVAPLARLLAVAFRAATDRAWERAVPPLDPARLRDGMPLLHGATVAVDEERIARLVLELAAVTPLPLGEGAPPRGHPERGRELLEATITQATDRLAELADEAGVEADALAAVGNAAALPLLQAAGRRAAPLLEEPDWEAGYCPVCAAWPTLAEMRGLERRRWLRCGRCGAGWRFRPLCCPYCGEDDHRQLGYLAPRRDRDSRRAEHCDSCHGYLKSLTVLGPTAPDELSAEDLATLELDLAALERGYGRPGAPGFPLELRVVAPERTPARRWLAWPR